MLTDINKVNGHGLRQNNVDRQQQTEFDKYIRLEVKHHNFT